MEIRQDPMLMPASGKRSCQPHPPPSCNLLTSISDSVKRNITAAADARSGCRGGSRRPGPRTTCPWSTDSAGSNRGKAAPRRLSTVGCNWPGSSLPGPSCLTWPAPSGSASCISPDLQMLPHNQHPLYLSYRALPYVRCTRSAGLHTRAYVSRRVPASWPAFHLVCCGESMDLSNQAV